MLLFGYAAVALAKDDRPNIIVIVADDLGYGDLGIHGCKDIPTPHIDSLAKNGVRCSNGYVSGPYCSPTRAGLLTGRYQQRFGHEFNPGPPNEGNKDIGLTLKESTLADRLKVAGYKTGMVGKWHLGHADRFHPIERGFGEFFGFLGGGHSYFTAQQRNNSILRGSEPTDERDYLTDAFAREAVAFIDRHQNEPFHLYLTFNAVHTPMHATENRLKQFEAIENQKRRTYAAMLTAMDEAIGAVLDKLREAKVEDNTLIFFVSDNGGPETANGSDNGPFRGQKAQTWEGGIHVPFFVQWKGRLPAGKVYDRPVIQLDIHPTALAAAGVDVETKWKLDGINLLPHLEGKSDRAPHDFLFWRFGGQIAVRQGDWKLVKAPGGGVDQAGARRAQADTTGAQLFNLASDPGEQKDLSADQAEMVAKLASAWGRWNAELAEPQWGPPQRAAAKKAKAKTKADNRKEP
jgi:arylsulfatase A-like enzyme